MTQKLESILNKSLKATPGLYGFKLQVMPLAHTDVPSDFIIHNKKGKTMYVECKEVTVKDGVNPRFAFSRFTQEDSLKLIVEFCPQIECYLLLSFRRRYVRDSNFFIVEIRDWLKFLSKHKHKSVSLDEAKNSFTKLDSLKGSVLDLFSLI